MSTRSKRPGAPYARPPSPRTLPPRPRARAVSVRPCCSPSGPRRAWPAVLVTGGGCVMGWEFGRKTGPSENVMVPATTDPFEGPKWAAPVLHMPPVLVLLVNLVQAVFRGLFFLVRHPIPVLTITGLGWLTWVFGWQAPALLGALVLVACGVWAAVDYASFLVWVARPVAGVVAADAGVPERTGRR